MESHFVDGLRRREERGRRAEVERRAYSSHDMVRRLCLSAELEGHEGCVNCLKWTASGHRLASGSDDLRVLVWDATASRLLQPLRTSHTNNIFSVEWLPGSGDRQLVSGAGDGAANLLDLHRPDAPLRAYKCHSHRVKRVAVAPGEGGVFWTGGEDGLVLEQDVREAASCADECSHCLVSLRELVGQDAEVKCLAVCPSRPELIAVGSNDPIVRLFDRRMLSRRRVRTAHALSDSSPRGFLAGLAPPAIPESSDKQAPPSASFCPAHISATLKASGRRKFRPLATTFLTFHPSRPTLLVNLGGEQIYTFDTLEQKQSLLESLPAELKTALERVRREGPGGGSGSVRGPVPALKGRRVLSGRAEWLKELGNAAFARGSWTEAVDGYSEALGEVPASSVLLGNRAAALMRRGWDGDVYAALRDAQRALALDPRNLKALFRTARCLAQLGLPRSAMDALELFKAHFPREASSSAFVGLAKDLAARFQPPDAQAAAADEAPGPSAGTTSAPTLWDFEERLVGHCNTTTDIKEANFIGASGELVMAGSDDGTLVTWELGSGRILSVLRGDESIVNCVQPHPTALLVATSGIDSTIKLWSPSGLASARQKKDLHQIAAENQRRMNADPFEAMLLNLYGARPESPNRPSDHRQPPDPNQAQCRQS